MTEFNNFLVIWRSDEDDFYHSEVKLGAAIDARQVSHDEWITHGAMTEGYTSERIKEMLAMRYELLLVSTMPTTFYV